LVANTLAAADRGAAGAAGMPIQVRKGGHRGRGGGSSSSSSSSSSRGRGPAGMFAAEAVNSLVADTLAAADRGEAQGQQACLFR
jgi:hypothetical protein